MMTVAGEKRSDFRDILEELGAKEEQRSSFLLTLRIQISLAE